MIREWHHSILVRDRRTGLDDDASKKMLGHVIRENRAKEKIKSNVPGEWKAGSCACTCLDATACIKLSRKNEGRNVVAHILVTIYKRRLLRQIPRSPRLAPLSLARSLANLSLSLSTLISRSHSSSRNGSMILDSRNEQETKRKECFFEFLRK